MKNYFDDIKDLYNKVSSLLIKIKETHPNLYQDYKNILEENINGYLYYGYEYIIKNENISQMYINKLNDIIKILNFINNKNNIKETSATGTGASFTAGAGENYATPYAFNPNKKAKGTAHNYYYKLGFKPVNQKALNKAAKGIEVKQLWEEEEPKFDIEGFVNGLGVDEETKQYIAGRLGDFDLIADKLKELIKLIQEAKKETINSYRETPEKKSVYGTDLAISILDRAIKLFT
jgi:hypothetical protein